MKPQLLALVKGWKIENDVHYLYVNVQLHNNTFDTLSFKTHGCSWEDIFITDTKLFTDSNEYICYSNPVVIVKLPPFCSYNKVIKLKKTLGINTGKMKFKIGVRLNKDEHNFKEINWNLPIRKNEITWTKDITL